MNDRYDDIGATYPITRQADPRIAAALHVCLGTGRSLLNVGAGTGNYEPRDRHVIAVEPSVLMLRQRPAGAAPAVRATGEHLPFPDDVFDAAMALLTIHHWADPTAGLQEMRRVSRRQVVLYFEPLHTHGFWAIDYFPEAIAVPSESNPPGEPILTDCLNVREIRTVLVPRDCIDGFGGAFWARPEAYLDPRVQAGMSWLALLPEATRRAGAARLATDLASGAWDRRHGHLRQQAEFDAGYRLAIAF